MVEDGKDSDEFEKMNLDLVQRSSPGDLSELIVVVMRVYVFEESLLKIKKKNATKNNPYICRALRRQMKINFDNHVIKRPSM